MSLKIFFQVLCLSLTLIQIRAVIKTKERDLQYESPDQEHKNYHHKHGRSHSEQKHEMMTQISSLLHSIFNKEYNNNRRMNSNDDTKLETISKTRAYVKSIFRSKFTETEINKNNNSEIKIVSKNLEQNGETDAIIDFNSNMDLINDKTFKAKSEEMLKPLEETHDTLLPKMAIYENMQGSNRRVKRDTTDEHSSDDQQKGESTDNSWKNVADAFKKVGEAVKAVYKKHVEEPVKKIANEIKNKIENYKKENDKKKNQQDHEKQHNDEHHEKGSDEKHGEEQKEK